MEDTMVRVGAMLRARMDATGMGPSDVARRAGVSRSQLHGYLTGAHAPSVVVYARVLDALGLDLSGAENQRWTTVEQAMAWSDDDTLLEMQQVDDAPALVRVARAYAAL